MEKIINNGNIDTPETMIDIKAYGYDYGEPAPPGLLPGRVTASHRDRYELICSAGAMSGRLKTGVYYGAGGEVFPTTGDYVYISPIDEKEALIVRTLPRKSQFIRRDPYVGDQVVASNFDYVFIMTSLNRDFNVRRIERYLALARQSGATPVVALTKADLAEDIEELCTRARAASLGAEVIPISVYSGFGLERLNAFMTPGKTMVFLGMSGVGKSSLLNALMGREVMTVNAIREDDSRGRHTTTHRQLFMLPSGAMVIDTPGMRSLGMWDAEEGVDATFAEVEAFFGSCRFKDCRHENEPGCAVMEAIESGALDASRWESYKSLRREALYAIDKTAAMKEKYARNKAIAKWSRQRKKSGAIKY